MKRSLNALCRILIPAVCSLPMLASSAAAQPVDRGPALEVFAGYFDTAGGDDNPRALGLRGSYKFTGVWAVEAAYTKVDVDGEVWFADASAKAYFFRSDRFRFYALGGPGIFRSRSFGETFNQDTVHLAFGSEIDLGARAYLRPEIRSHWATDDISWDGRLSEISLGFGWRF